MRLHVVGCSHHSSSVAVRERLAFSPAQTRTALRALSEQFPASEAVLISTCNRVELYLAEEDSRQAPSHEDVGRFLAEFHGLKLADVFDELFERTGEDAVRHLFMVAASLDSMVIGESQILAQVKQSYELATELGASGPLTHAAFQAALRTARRVVSETQIQQKRLSIPSVAIGDFARQIFERFDDKQILVIGGGEMAEETLRYLVDEGARDITVINRTLARADALAGGYGGRVVPWERLLDHLAEADLVISTTGAERPVVTVDDYARIEERRFQRPLFVLDLAIPRDFEPGVGDRLGVFLYSIDDLRAACERNRRERDRELPMALHIIEEETTNFLAELHHRATGPLIARLKQGWQGPKEDELRRLFNKLPQLDERSRDEIRHAFDRLTNKLLHPPLESLRDEARNGTPHVLIDALKRLFQLRE